jgi:hypothetical protein
MCTNFYKSVMDQPTILYTAASTNSSGDNVLVVAPAAGTRIAVLYMYVENESAVVTVAKLGVAGDFITRSTLAQYGYYERYFTDRPYLLPEATALTLNLGGANAHAYAVEYVEIPA